MSKYYKAESILKFGTKYANRNLSDGKWTAKDVARASASGNILVAVVTDMMRGYIAGDVTKEEDFRFLYDQYYGGYFLSFALYSIDKDVLVALDSNKTDNEIDALLASKKAPSATTAYTTPLSSVFSLQSSVFSCT